MTAKAVRAFHSLPPSHPLTVLEVVVLDAGEADGDAIKVRDVTVIHKQLAGCTLPDGPGLGGGEIDGLILAHEALVVGGYEVAVLCLRDGCEVVLPRIREDVRGTLLRAEW